jgi:hypothetical protein
LNCRLAREILGVVLKHVADHERGLERLDLG